MKRKKIYLLVMSTFVFWGCNNPIILSKTNTQTTTESYESNILDFIASTQVNLKNGVQQNHVGLTIEGYSSLLSDNLEKRTGRTIVDNETIIEQKQLTEIFSNIYSNIDIPELLHPSDEDIEKINLDYPLLSKQEIIENLPIISLIYQSEISSLAINDIIQLSNIDDLSSSQRNIYDKTYDIFDEKVTLGEVAACLKHPFSAITLMKQKDIAFNLTKQYMKYHDHTDDKSDAFRHAIWNIVMAKEGWGLKNEKIAWANDFATAHEAGKKYYGLASEMDLHNNRVGLNYYKSVATKTYSKILWWNIETGVKEPGYDVACKYIKQKTENAILVNKNNFTLENGRTRINAIDSNSLVYIIPDNNSY